MGKRQVSPEKVIYNGEQSSAHHVRNFFCIRGLGVGLAAFRGEQLAPRWGRSTAHSPFSARLMPREYCIRSGAPDFRPG